MRRLLELGVIFALILNCLFITPFTVSAHQSCTDTVVRLFEHINRQGDSRDFCGNINDLNNWTHLQPGNCGDAIIGDNSWDDCASSWQVISNVHMYCIQIWSNPLSFGFFKGPLLEGGFRAKGYWSNFDGSENDKATSIEWENTLFCGAND